MVEAINYLHNHCNMIHFDLKPENVCLTKGDSTEEAQVIKLIDFENSVKLPEGTYSYSSQYILGTPLYLAPEWHKYQGDGLTSAVDMYSYGIILKVLVAKNHMKTLPMHLTEPLDIIKFNHDRGHELKLPVDETYITENGTKLINGLLSTDPKARINARYIVDNLKAGATLFKPKKEEKIDAHVKATNAAHNLQTVKPSQPDEASGPSLIPLEAVTYDPNPISKGDYSNVYRSQYQSNDVAIKIFSDPKTDPTVEAGIQAKLKHSNIVKLIGYINEASLRAIVLELCHAGNLENYLLNNELPNTKEERELLAVDIIKGIEYLHNVCRMIHRDIKPANIVLEKSDSGFMAKITDFGLSNQLNPGKISCFSKAAGTSHFTAPELIPTRDGESIMVTCASDIFSFGHILHLLVQNLQNEPIKNVEEPQMMKFIRDGKVENMRLNTEHCVPTAVKLIQYCLKTNPERRNTASEILRELEPGKKLFNYPKV